ncbi:hypothetical protein Syun_001911 [Stephania yunnanensis]|uniref:Uncharacterized protein n=1 Tax=Stephania yunnanensis TaxID=152371 RepID=A0AAP0LF01_9MAGN
MAATKLLLATRAFGRPVDATNHHFLALDHPLDRLPDIPPNRSPEPSPKDGAQPPSANKTRHDNIMITCGRWLTVPHAAPRRKFMTGTLLGSKKGHVSFVVQEHPRSDPVLVVELATSTSALMREMASTGLVRIALECERRWSGGGGQVRLHEEKRWSMYCNGRMCGYAVGRACGEVDWEVLSVLQAVTVGAGVIPMKATGGEQVMYMRARFERVVGGRDSEAYYMMNPDKTGGPELTRIQTIIASSPNSAVPTFIASSIVSRRNDRSQDQLSNLQVDMAKEFLKTHELSFSSRPVSAAVHYLSFGLADFFFASYIPYWKFMKKVSMSQLLGGRTLEQSQHVRHEEIHAELIRLTNNLITRLTMNRRCSELDNDAE